MTTSESRSSLSDEATFAGPGKRRSAAEMSLGDERTLGDRLDNQDTEIDDIEVVDLEARYKVEGTLGQGGMGAVLLATDTRLGRKVAVKRILGEAARSKTAIMRFLTEAKAIAALNHPNIVQIYDYGRAKDGPFLIMEYVDGGSLLDRCRDGALPLEDAVELACQLCDGLAKAHDAGIVHRDIKPANVLLNKDGLPKLTDFGLAKAEATDHQMTMTGAVMGTPDFMPPEQRRDASEVDARSDLWSLAATVYQMVTGRSPKIIRFNDIPATLQDVLAKALEDRKELRYQSAVALQEALRQTAGLRPSSTTARSPAPTVDDQQEGRCSDCGTINTDLSRKFCRTCGGPLRVACLKCSGHMPVWEKICGECGANQQQLIADLRATLDRKRMNAESLAAAGSLEEAIAVARELGDETHPAIVEIVSWATDFMRVAAAEIKRRDERVRVVHDALAHNDLQGACAAVAGTRAEAFKERDRPLVRQLLACEAFVTPLAEAILAEQAGDWAAAAAALATIAKPSQATVVPGRGETVGEFSDRVQQALHREMQRQERKRRHAARREQIATLRTAKEARDREAAEACVSEGIAAEDTRCVFETTLGPLVVVIQRSWSPHWALWFAKAVAAGAFDMTAMRLSEAVLPACSEASFDERTDSEIESIDASLRVVPTLAPPGPGPQPTARKIVLERQITCGLLVAVACPSDPSAPPAVVLNAPGGGGEAMIGWIDQDSSVAALTALQEATNLHATAPDTVIGVVKTVRLADPPDCWDLTPRLQRGIDLANESRWEESVAIFEAAVAEDPQNAKAWVGIGQGLKQLGRFEDGIAAMERARAANPSKGLFVYNLACYHAMAGHAGPAVEFLSKAVAIMPKWQQAAKQDPDFAALRRDKAFLAVVGDREPARRVQAELKQGLKLAESGHHEEAVATLRDFTERHPDVTDAWVAIGWCLKKLERPGDAAEAMRLAIEAVGKHPRLLYNLACYHSLAGDDTEALQALMAAISRYPQYAQVAAKDRDFDRVRSDPRFAAIVAGVNAVSG